jgi:hypothetical protein
METINIATREMRVEDVRFPGPGPKTMSDLKCEREEWPPLEKILQAKIWTDEGFEKERAWWGKSKREPFQKLASVAFSKVGGIREITVTPQ